jgi:hypothetical protein
MFKHTEKTAETFNSILHDYQKIDSDTEMCKRGLEYNEYKRLGLILDTLRYMGQITIDQVYSDNTVNWLKTFNVIIDDGIIKL